MAVRGDLNLLALTDRLPAVVSEPDVPAGVEPVLKGLRRPFRVHDLKVPVDRAVGRLPPDQDVRGAVNRIDGLGLFLLLDREGEVDELVVGGEGRGHAGLLGDFRFGGLGLRGV